jgi:ABC-2 type transport system ATP-binding protein
MIYMRNVSKGFGGKAVLEDVCFEVEQGEIFGLLGPSGAGKTTIINILTQQIEPDGGEAGVDVPPREVGLMLDSGGLYPHLNGLENLGLYARIYGLPKTTPQEVLNSVGLGDDAKKAASTLSRGMSQRLALARAILYAPKVLFLDEPTSALDPGTARGICKLLRELCDDGATIFLTTHNMEEATHLCDRVVMLHNGKIIEQGDPKEICGRHNATKTTYDLENVFVNLTGGGLQ